MTTMQIQEAPTAMIDRVSTVLDAFVGQRPLTLVEVAGRTSLRWEGEVHLSGPVATLGERIVKSTVDKKAAGLFENARRKLEAR